MKQNYFSSLVIVMMVTLGLFSCQKPSPEGEDKLTQCLTPTSLSCTVNEYEASFTWTATKDAESYNLVIAKDADFATTVEAVTVDPEELPYVTTLEEGEYYFKVQATSSTLDPSNWAICETVVKVLGDTRPATDLSAKATANCYIVSAAGKYKFKPTKGCTADPVGTITKVQLLWETSTEDADAALAVNSVISKVALDADGNIEFATPKNLKPGNAVIAAISVTKETDATTGLEVDKETVLWSWHIWLTSDPITDVTVSDGFVLMDRNIGELSASARTSMLYQWGRKDPFPGTIGGTKKVAVAGVATSARKDNASVDYSIKNPTVLGAAKTEYTDGKVQAVHADYYARLWGEDVKDKTLHDPCPAGYKVPWAYEGGVDGIKTDNKIDNTRFAALAGLTYANNAFSMTNPAISFYGGGFYNFSGGADAPVSADLQMSTDSFTLWTATCRGSSKKRSAGCIHGDATGVQYIISVNDADVKYNGRAAAYPIRCEKM